MSNLGGIIDVAVGMSFVYLLLSLACSGINELLAWVLGLRSSTLRQGIETLLEDPQLGRLAARVYQHPMVRRLSQEDPIARLLGRGPSNIPSTAFALALLDTLRDHPQGSGGARGIDTLAGLKQVLASLPEGPLRGQLELLVDDGIRDVAAYRQRVEVWFNQGMDRLSAAYKRRAQLISVGVGLALAVACGVDSGVFGKALARDGTLRQGAVAAAVEASKQKPVEPGPGGPDEKAAAQRVVSALGELDQLELPVGLPYLMKAAPTGDVAARGYWFWRALGMLFTGLAVALGAPFWFDMLGKLISVRSPGSEPGQPGKS